MIIQRRTVLCAVVAYRSTYCTYINASKAWIHQYLVALKPNIHTIQIHHLTT